MTRKALLTHLMVLASIFTLCTPPPKCKPDSSIKACLIHSDSLMNSYHGQKEAIKRIEQTIAPWKRQVQALQDTIRVEKNEHIREVLLTRYKEMVEEYFSAGGKAATIQASYMKPVYAELNEHIVSFCKTSGYHFVIDVKDTTVIYVNERKTGKTKPEASQSRQFMQRNGICDLGSYPNVTDTLIAIANQPSR